MRVLHVNKFLYRRGGAEGYMLDLAARQRAHGHEVRLFGMEHPENDAPFVLGPQPSYVEFEPPPSGGADRLRLAGRMLWSRESRRALGDALDRWRPDLVHCHNIYHQLSPSVLAAARTRGIPVVLTMHDYKLVCPTYQFLDHGRPCTACVEGGPWQALRRRCKDGSTAASGVAAAEVWLHRRLRAYDPVASLVAPSRFLADQVRAGGVFPDRVTVLDNFTDVDGVEPQGAPGHGAVFAGRLSHEKGVDVLIRALREVAPVGPPGTPVLEVVGDGPERGELEALAAEVAPGLVHFHGRLPKAELLAVVARAAVSVVPSRWYENQPLSVLESYAAGVPVIASAMGGLPELVDEGGAGGTEGTGWLVPAEDPAALAGALDAALQDPVGAHRRGRNARAVAERRFSPEVHLAGLERVYATATGAAS